MKVEIVCDSTEQSLKVIRLLLRWGSRFECSHAKGCTRVVPECSEAAVQAAAEAEGRSYGVWVVSTKPDEISHNSDLRVRSFATEIERNAFLAGINDYTGTAEGYADEEEASERREEIERERAATQAPRRCRRERARRRGRHSAAPLHDQRE